MNDYRDMCLDWLDAAIHMDQTALTESAQATIELLRAERFEAAVVRVKFDPEPAPAVEPAATPPDAEATHPPAPPAAPAGVQEDAANASEAPAAPVSVKAKRGGGRRDKEIEIANRKRAAELLTAPPGRSNNAIARDVGCSFNTVAAVRKKLGIPPLGHDGRMPTAPAQAAAEPSDETKARRMVIETLEACGAPLIARDVDAICRATHCADTVVGSIIAEETPLWRARRKNEAAAVSGAAA